MTQAGEYRRGETVRIVRCPLNNQHAGQTGTVLESPTSPSHLLCIELDDGQRCWTLAIERITDAEDDHA